MRITVFIAAACFILCSCQREATNNLSPASTLNGSWKMIIVEDDASGTAITKPSSVQGDVVITFSPSISSPGTYYGHTPSNEIGQSQYTVTADRLLTILNLAMTKVAETSWGAEFVDNIRAARNYQFEKNGNLDIRTVNKTLVFHRQ